MGKAIGLDGKDVLTNIDLEVLNYHRPMLGTFHSKFMVVDRKIALIQSNNIQVCGSWVLSAFLSFNYLVNPCGRRTTFECRDPSLKGVANFSRSLPAFFLVLKISSSLSRTNLS